MSFRHRISASLMRIVPGSKAHGMASYWRDLARLAQADVALVSFPKSGRTFVRVMLARLYKQQFGIDERETLRFKNLRLASDEVPRILFTHNGDAMRVPEKIKINRNVYAGRKVVLLSRHPGDVVVSRYFHLKHRSSDPARHRLARQPLDNFIWTEQGGVPSIVRFLNQWAQYSRDRRDILPLRYEDFLGEPERTLQLLAEFVGLRSDQASIKEAVEFARFDNLKQKEREGYFTSSRLGPGCDGKEGSFKVRVGKAGGYRTSVSEENRTLIDRYVSKHLDPMFGY